MLATYMGQPCSATKIEGDAFFVDTELFEHFRRSTDFWIDERAKIYETSSIVSLTNFCTVSLGEFFTPFYDLLCLAFVQTKKFVN